MLRNVDITSMHHGEKQGAEEAVANSFRLFWEGATLVSKKVKIVYLHGDEKWFASIAVWMNGKICQSLSRSLPYIIM